MPVIDFEPDVAFPYASPFNFTGTILTVGVGVSGELIHDPEAGLRVHAARQLAIGIAADQR